MKDQSQQATSIIRVSCHPIQHKHGVGARIKVKGARPENPECELVGKSKDLRIAATGDFPVSYL